LQSGRDTLDKQIDVQDITENEELSVQDMEVSVYVTTSMQQNSHVL
jgi:hypothetical protein